MEENFYTILTDIGKATLANNSVLGSKLKFSKFQVGDSNGEYYNPDEKQTELKHKVWEGNISSVSIDSDNPSWIVLETIIPANIGGFKIREAGAFDDTGNLIAIGKYPESYKPVISEGSAKELIIKMILVVSNVETVELKLDPTVAIATKKDILFLTNDVNKKIEKFAIQYEDCAKIVIAETEIPIAKRKKETFYYIVTEKNITANEEIKVSPTMGLKIQK